MNPYQLPADEWVLISFSGGRSSGYMLKNILEANKGLPEKTVVCFANTGREMPETLDFVNECSIQWGVPIVWLEYTWNGEKSGFKVVNYETASRDGEPFTTLIKRKKFLPNVVTRYCTEELKIKTMHRYMRREHGTREFLNIIGIRADEPHRVAKTRIKNQTENLRPCSIPLADAGVTKQEVSVFWMNAGFDLALDNQNGTTPLGNCDMCFLKGAQKLASIGRDYPHLVNWWSDREKDVFKTLPEGARPENASFIKGLPYEKLINVKQVSVFEGLEPVGCLGCTD